MLGYRVAASALAFALPTAAVAADRMVVHPVQIGQETVRYNQGVATLDLWSESGAVQLTPLPMYRGSLAFSVAVFNGGGQPVNFGIQNIIVDMGGQQVAIFTREDLERRAENRARWRQFFLALGGAFSAAATQTSTYRATTITPYGGAYYTTVTGPSLVGELRAEATRRDAIFGIGAIQARLDQTRAQLANEIVQLSTVDPGDGYAGSFVLHKINGRGPYNLRITVNWNGQEYPFGFLVGRRGTPAPVFTQITPAMPPATLLARMNAATASPDLAMPATDATQPAAPAFAPAAAPPARLIQASSPRSQPSGLLRPADTASGYCINAPSDYRGTGSRSRPAVTSAMPRCETLGQ